MTKKTGGTKSRSRVRIRVRADEDNVGYRNPPRAHRFRAGQSGNPMGRPKGAKSESTILAELLTTKIGLKERGRERKIIVHEAIYRRITEDALRGDIKAATFILNRHSAVQSGETARPDISEDDKAVLEEYLLNYEAKLKAKKEPS